MAREIRIDEVLCTTKQAIKRLGDKGALPSDINQVAKLRRDDGPPQNLYSWAEVEVLASQRAADAARERNKTKAVQAHTDDLQALIDQMGQLAELSKMILQKFYTEKTTKNKGQIGQ